MQKNRAPGAYLDRLVENLEKADLGALALEDRCKYYAHLRDHILQAAREADACRKNPLGQVIVVDETKFERAISALKRLGEGLQFSKNINDWLNASRTKLVSQLKTEWPPDCLQKEWDRRSIPQRINLVMEFMKAQCAVYKEGAMPFLPPPSMILMYDPRIAGGIPLEPEKIETSFDIPPLYLNVVLLDKASPEEALITAHHEQIHLFFHQMAMAERLNMIPAGHPLGEDARKALLMKRFRSYNGTEIHSGYMADAEEVVCHAQHERFTQEFIRPALEKPERKWFFGLF